MSLTSLLDISRRALSAQTQAIRTTGDNISNVNTEGYTRRRVDFVTTSAEGPVSARTGTGVDIKSVSRVVDKFINSEQTARMSDTAMADIRNEFLARAEAPFAVDNEPGRIGYQLNEFFSSLQDLRSNPTSIPLRTQVLERGEQLVRAIRSTYDELAKLQREADNRVGVLVEDVNRITTSIATINLQISRNEWSDDQEAITLRDQRDQLLRELSEKVSFRTIEDTLGQVTVYLDNGFALVNGGQSRNIGFDTTPSFAPAGGYPQALDGSDLGHVVYEYAADEQIDLTGVLRSGGGEIGGLLSLRGTYPNVAFQDTFDGDGDLISIAGRVEGLARDLMYRFNEAYYGGGTARGLDGSTPRPYGLFSFDGAAAGNNFGDVDGDNVVELSDINSIIASTTNSFARDLTFAVGSERAFAAARITAAGTAPGDDANLIALLNLRDSLYNYGSFAIGSLSANSTIDDYTDVMSSTVGGMARAATDQYNVAKGRQEQVNELQSSVSGVNIDEELSKLITYQRGYQAAARMIRLADELLTDLMGIMS